jgi:hypothetical protein
MVNVKKAKDFSYLLLGAAILFGSTYLWGKHSAIGDTPDTEGTSLSFRVKDGANSWDCGAVVPNFKEARPISQYKAFEVPIAQRNRNFVYGGQNGWEYWYGQTWWDWNGWVSIPYYRQDECYEIIRI